MTGTSTTTSTTEFFFWFDSCRGLPLGWPNNAAQFVKQKRYTAIELSSDMLVLWRGTIKPYILYISSVFAPFSILVLHPKTNPPPCNIPNIPTPCNTIASLQPGGLASPYTVQPHTHAALVGLATPSSTSLVLHNII